MQVNPSLADIPSSGEDTGASAVYTSTDIDAVMTQQQDKKLTEAESKVIYFLIPLS